MAGPSVDCLWHGDGASGKAAPKAATKASMERDISGKTEINHMLWDNGKRLPFSSAERHSCSQLPAAIQAAAIAAFMRLSVMQREVVSESDGLDVFRSHPELQLLQA